MENIDQIHNEFISFVLTGTNGLDEVNSIDCPFVPDIIRVTGFSDDDFGTSSAVQVTCSAFQNKVIAIITEPNTGNPTITFTNKERRTFQGQYRFDFRKFNNATDTHNGSVALNFEFIRFKNVHL
jgi:hypothetical protein